MVAKNLILSLLTKDQLSRVVEINEFGLDDLIKMSEVILRVVNYILAADEVEEVERSTLKTLLDFKISIDDVIEQEISHIDTKKLLTIK